MNTVSRPNNGKRWEEEDDADLTSRISAGQFVPEIARGMGRSQEAIRTRANILGLPVRSSARPRRAIPARSTPPAP